jgi:hypothetical protein
MVIVTSWHTISSEKLTVVQLIKNSSSFSKPQNSLSWFTSAPPLCFILSHMNSVHTFKYHLFKIHFNIIIQTKPRFPSGIFPSDFPTNTLYSTSDLSDTCSAHLIFLKLISQTIPGKMYMSLSSSLCNFY